MIDAVGRVIAIDDAVAVTVGCDRPDQGAGANGRRGRNLVIFARGARTQRQRARNNDRQLSDFHYILSLADAGLSTSVHSSPVARFAAAPACQQKMPPGKPIPRHGRRTVR
jgi:hypothetical protein